MTKSARGMTSGALALLRPAAAIPQTAPKNPGRPARPTEIHKLPDPSGLYINPFGIYINQCRHPSGQLHQIGTKPREAA